MKAKKIWKRFCAWISELGDRAKLALVGFACCIRKPKYALAFALSFFLFYFFLTFFSDGTSNWSLLWSHISIEQKLSVLGHVSAKMVTGLASLSGVCLALISLLQGAVIRRYGGDSEQRHSFNYQYFCTRLPYLRYFGFDSASYRHCRSQRFDAR